VVVSDGTEGAARVADVLVLFADVPHPIGVSAVARRLGLSKTVVHRILRSLVDRRLLVTDPTTHLYQLGPAAASIGARALRDSDLRLIALPLLRDLQAATGETTTLSTVVSGGRVYLAQVEGQNEIKMTVELGRRFPLHAGSSGRAILAFLAIEERDAVIASGLMSLTGQTIVDPKILRASLDEVRRCGVAKSGGERQPGAASVAAPVFNLDGGVLGAISVCGPVTRMTLERGDELVPLLGSTADRISVGLGWRGGLPDDEQEPSGSARFSPP